MDEGGRDKEGEALRTCEVLLFNCRQCVEKFERLGIGLLLVEVGGWRPT
jgi:hypothetical protein